jgi:hypothetical protein
MTASSSAEGWAATSIDVLGHRGSVAPQPGSVVRVAAPTALMVRDAGDEDAVYVVAGREGGFVGRDGRLPEGETVRHRPSTRVPGS